MIPDFLLDLIYIVISEPLLLGVLLAAATFISEDAALILGSQLVATHQSSPGTIVPALILGILIGDLGLYWLGSAARTNRRIRRKIPLKAARKFKHWISGRETVVLFASRFMPGARLPTYVSFGFLGLSLTRFFIVMTIAAVLWVTTTIFFIQEIQAHLMAIDNTFGLIGGFLIAFILIFIIPSFIKRSQRMAQYSTETLDNETDDQS